MAQHTFNRLPPAQSYGLVSFPAQHVMLVIFNRPKALNAMTSDAEYELEALWEWYDDEPSLRCAIVTGAGRAFCAGMDLKEWNQINQRKRDGIPEKRPMDPPTTGFGGLSRRSGKKPIIAAVNGLAMGGGFEIIANLDLIVAAKSATFALPEAKIGVVANAGSLPRLARTIGRPRATEMALTGRSISAAEAREFGFLNAITEDAPPDSDVLERPVVQKALEYAALIIKNSPDSVIVSRAGILAGWEHGSAENAVRVHRQTWDKIMADGHNFHEGVQAFVEKRAPRWVDKLATAVSDTEKYLTDGFKLFSGLWCDAMASSCGEFTDPCQSDQIMNLSITPPHEKKKNVASASWGSSLHPLRPRRHVDYYYSPYGNGTKRNPVFSWVATLLHGAVERPATRPLQPGPVLFTFIEPFATCDTTRMNPLPELWLYSMRSCERVYPPE
ncbi:ClpP/crotonase-like domain-containing protein [Fusarium oxysporum]|nr:ClpP/crotonase-like domain-containing protein [Fusarium oxysporum]